MGAHDNEGLLNIIIFSKDRAAQLDLLLRSMDKHFKNYEKQNIIILYAYSNEAFKEGYGLLIKRMPHYSFVLESNFKMDVMSLINPALPYVMFLVDDDVFKESFSIECPELMAFTLNKKILALSLRMDRRMNRCYSQNIKVVPPKENVWEWRRFAGDWKTAMSTDGNIFRTAELFPLLKRLPFKNPNTLESLMSKNPLSNKLLICFDVAKLTNNPCNRVQNQYKKNRSGTVSAEYINRKFLDGEIIDLKILDGKVFNAPHTEMGLSFVPFEGGN